MGTLLLIALTLAASPIASVQAEEAKKVFILGIDGMDPNLLDKFLEEGAMPNFKKLIEEGDYKRLQTTMPALSPVAWSTFITGQDPGGHGIFDFIHRKAETLEPFMSTSEVLPPGKTLELGTWVLPLSGGGSKLLRKGRAFWQILEEHGVPTTIFRMPANYPPVESPGRSFSGMGTTDILGTPGTFTFYTNRPPPNANDISGGQVVRIRVIDYSVKAQLIGPPNTFRRIPKTATPGWRADGAAEVEYETPDCTIDFEVFLDPEESVAKFVVQDEEFILKEGEWSDWVSLEFEAVPFLVNISATARFYLQQVRPFFKLYVSPLQISPENPAMTISTPEDWAHELYEALGNFYTQELPEDTKVLSAGIFSGEEFWTQSQLVYKERRRALDYFLENLGPGLTFFYFSSVDQNSHMLWRYMDEQHPAFERHETLSGGIQFLYEAMDESLGRVREVIDDDPTLIVMSDHGFAPFYWGVGLNSWLLEKGYVTLKDPSRQGRFAYFGNVDWSRTRAYALGLSGLYLNLKGREKDGIVTGEEYDALLDQLESDLLAMRDPRNGNQPVTLVTRTRRDFSGPYLDVGPDIIVGYGRGYRSSWESPLGEFTREIFTDNMEAWSGDHLIDRRLVPGVLITNRKITLEEPALYDLTVAVLDEYGIAPTPEMIGEDCLAPLE